MLKTCFANKWVDQLPCHLTWRISTLRKTWLKNKIPQTMEPVEEGGGDSSHEVLEIIKESPSKIKLLIPTSRAEHVLVS